MATPKKGSAGKGKGLGSKLTPVQQKAAKKNLKSFATKAVNKDAKARPFGASPAQAAKMRAQVAKVKPGGGKTSAIKPGGSGASIDKGGNRKTATARVGGITSNPGAKAPRVKRPSGSGSSINKGSAGSRAGGGGGGNLDAGLKAFYGI